MKTLFREAFIAHLEAAGISVADVARATGVSKEQLYKLKQRKVASTQAEDAMAVAHFFGESLEDFTRDKVDPRIATIVTLFSGLSAVEQDILRAQIEAVAARPGRGTRKQDEVAPR